MGNFRKYAILTTRRLLVAVALTAVVVAGYVASTPSGTGPAAGEQLGGHFLPAANRPTTLRVGTFNIHSGRGSDGLTDLMRTAACLETAALDLVALQEVRGNRASGANQARTLAERLQMAWLYAPAERRWGVLEFGNGLLAAIEVKSWQRVVLPRRFAADHRNAVLAVVEHHGRAIQVLMTHIHRRDQRERDEQLQAAAEMFLSLEKPAILLGDLNCSASEPPLRQLLDTPGVEDAVGQALRRKGAEDMPGRVDWIITRGLRAVDAGIVDHGASDHPLVWAELELP